MSPPIDSYLELAFYMTIQDSAKCDGIQLGLTLGHNKNCRFKHYRKCRPWMDVA